MMELREFTTAGFEITWKLLDIGFRRCKYFVGCLSPRTVIDYAQSQLEETEDEQILMLAAEYEDDIEGIDACLCLLAKRENTSFELEFRKWRVLYVRDSLPKTNTDYVAGLIKLLEMWGKFDFPDDSPHVIQGRYNQIAPEDYYTEDNYKILLKKNQDWIHKEIDEIRRKKQ
ncbi:MAG: DUF2247 family protein [Clostridiales Family XIII bacterium]|jgi:hypothetical protein|nr:DUF2247 family protein [Clostridiales Family XIII bacterium]